MRSFEKQVLGDIPKPMRSATKGYIICKECGQWFSTSLRGLESYKKHYEKEHLKTEEIKCYVDGCYTFGRPDYGGIKRVDNNKLLYLCDYGVTLTENAKRCAQKMGWKFKKRYHSKKHGDMVLVFEGKE